MEFEVRDRLVRMTTVQQTDLWQRTYYGFRNDNAPCYLFPVRETEFSFTVKAEFQPKTLFDQCGIVLYQDTDNWVKTSVEYINEEFSRLGSVVTNLGYSDWATVDIDSDQTSRYYRLSRRAQDFFIESSLDGNDFQQMRILHMHREISTARIGVYACSPLDSSFEAQFSQISLGACVWELHNGLE